MKILSYLESYAIHVLREAAAQFENVALLFSGGKDSAVLLHLAHKAFYPASLPIKLLHVDTGHNFPEVLSYIQDIAKHYKVNLLTHSMEQMIQDGKFSSEILQVESRNAFQGRALMDAIKVHKINACLGGGRRDEEKARAKERIFSHRNRFGEWNPKKQRPEFFDTLNGKMKNNDHFRVFPISNWTEKDIWHYIKQENIQLPSLYFAHQRKVFMKNNFLFPESPYIQKDPAIELETKSVRFRTVGDMTCSIPHESHAKTIDEIITELELNQYSERFARFDDKTNAFSMEKRKQQGYF